VFQIGSTTNAFLAATISTVVDRGKLYGNDRVVA
jgi:hypothetical protein